MHGLITVSAELGCEPGLRVPGSLHLARLLPLTHSLSAEQDSLPQLYQGWGSSCSQWSLGRKKSLSCLTRRSSCDTPFLAWPSALKASTFPPARPEAVSGTGRGSSTFFGTGVGLVLLPRSFRLPLPQLPLAAPEQHLTAPSRKPLLALAFSLPTEHRSPVPHPCFPFPLSSPAASVAVRTAPILLPRPTDQEFPALGSPLSSSPPPPFISPSGSQRPFVKFFVWI